MSSAWIIDTKDVAAPSAGPASPVKARLESRTLRDATEIMTETAVKMDRAENNRQDKLQSITTKLGAHNKKADDAKSQKEITEAKKLQELKQANDAKLEASEIRRAEHVNGKVEKVSAKLQKNSEGVQNKLHQEAVEAVEKKHEIGVQQRQAELRRAVHLPASSKAVKSAVAIVIESDTVVRAPASPAHKRLAAPKASPSKDELDGKMMDAETRRTEQMEQVAGKAANHNKHAEGVKVQVQEGAQQWTEAMKQAVIAKLALAEQRRAEHVNGKAEKVSAKLQKNSEGVQNKLHQEAVEAVEKKTEIGVQQRQAELRRAVNLPGSKANKACKAKAAIAIVIESDTVVRAPASPVHKRLAAPKASPSKDELDGKMMDAETRRTEQMEQVAGKAANHNKHAEGVKVQVQEGAQQWTEAMKQAVIAKLALAEQRRAEHVNGKAEKVSAKLQKNSEGVQNKLHQEAVEAVEKKTEIGVQQRQAELRRAVHLPGSKANKACKAKAAIAIVIESDTVVRAPSSPTHKRLAAPKKWTEAMKQAVIDKMANAETRRTEQMEQVAGKAAYHNKHAEGVKVQVQEGAQQWTEAMKQAVIAKLALAEQRRAEHVNGKAEKVSAKLQKNSEGVQNKLHQEAVEAVEKKTEIGVQQRQAELRRAVHLPGSKANKACKAKAAIAMIIGETEAAVKAPASPVHKRLAAPRSGPRP